MNEITTNNIKNMIYNIRGFQVMIDSDLAKLYGVETKYLNRQVKRNIDRFPNDYMFEISRNEYSMILRCQNVTIELEQGKYSKYPPHVFTEKGIYMLGNILKSKEATEMSLFIINKFVELKFLVNTINTERISNIESKLLDHDNKINSLIESFNSKTIASEYLFYDGEIYDAYSLLLNIFNTAKKEIVIFDNYMNNRVLDMIDKSVDIILIRNSNINDDVINKYTSQYNNLKIIINDNFHDRFIIIDKKELYHVGLSLKDIGKKCFAISEMNNAFIDKLIAFFI